MSESPAAIPKSESDDGYSFEDAASAAERGESEGSGGGTPFGGQIANVQRWAEEQEALIPESVFTDLPIVSDSTSEHQVFYRAADSRVVKRTWAGVYGQIPWPSGGRLDRINATPSQYLRRMALHNSVFESRIFLEGVTVSDRPSMVIGQPPRSAILRHIAAVV